MKLFCMNDQTKDSKDKELPKTKQRMVSNSLKLPKNALNIFRSKEGCSSLQELSFAPDRDSMLKNQNSSQRSSTVNFSEFCDNLNVLLKSLVRSKTGSEYLGSDEVQINKQNWSKKLYSMVLEEGIPNNLHFDQELLTSVVVNLFSHCLENMSKSFVYINIDYCFKA